MKVIGFCGLPGSGKSTALEAIKDLGVIITMGNVIRDEAKKRNLAFNDNNLGKIAKDLRMKEGDEIIAEKSIEMIKKQKCTTIFVDGIRSIPEIKLFRREWKFPLIAIETNEKLRYERILDRSRSDDGTKEMINVRDRREKEFGLEEVIEIADYTIYNNTTIDDLKERTKECVLNIIKNY